MRSTSSSSSNCAIWRIRGQGKTFVRLFYEAGADCVETLAGWNPTRLQEKLYKLNEEQGPSDIVPSLKDVGEYVEMAKELPKALEANDSDAPGGASMHGS
jgi:hypothetical protein